MPQDSVLAFETPLKTGRFLAIASGTAEDVARAHSILAAPDPESLHRHTVATAVAI